MARSASAISENAMSPTPACRCVRGPASGARVRRASRRSHAHAIPMARPVSAKSIQPDGVVSALSKRDGWMGESTGREESA